jgi:hypothetical protein
LLASNNKKLVLTASSSDVLLLPPPPAITKILPAYPKPGISNPVLQKWSGQKTIKETMPQETISSKFNPPLLPPKTTNSEQSYSKRAAGKPERQSKHCSPKNVSRQNPKLETVSSYDKTKQQNTKITSSEKQVQYFAASCSSFSLLIFFCYLCLCQDLPTSPLFLSFFLSSSLSLSVSSLVCNSKQSIITLTQSRFMILFWNFWDSISEISWTEFLQ